MRGQILLVTFVFCLVACNADPAQCNVAGGHGTCKAGMATSTTRFCIGGNRDCGVFHHGGGAAGDCAQELSMYGDKYIQCDEGYEPSAEFDSQSTPDGQGACLFTCQYVPPQCNVAGGHGTCKAGMADATTRFCIGGNRDCGVFHHGGGAAGDCTEETTAYAGNYVQCDDGYQPSAIFDAQSTPDGQGACLFSCEAVGPVPGPPTPPGPPSPHGSPGAGMSPGAKAGIAIGVVLGVAMIGGMTAYTIHLRKRSNQLEALASSTECLNSAISERTESPLAVAAEEPVLPKSEAEAHQQRFL